MAKAKFILGIETSCDETSAAILKQGPGSITVISHVVASSANLQEKYGGVIPEQAAREQLKSIIPVIQETFLKATEDGKSIEIKDIDSIAVTYGPGLIGSLLVGVETAKTLALIWHKPLVPINHLIGHFYANWIVPEKHNTPKFPCIGLLVSGGHTDLILFKDHSNYEFLGGTRDDAAGECFDKCARLLGYAYPGGPKISLFAEKGDSTHIKMPIPMTQSQDFDFSFSGLKTFFSNLVEKEFEISNFNPSNAQERWKRVSSNSLKGKDQYIADLCSTLENTIVSSLVGKTIKAMKKYNIKNLIIAGGVSANQRLRDKFFETLTREIPDFSFHVPEKSLCTDNAAMIAAAAFFSTTLIDPFRLQANPNLSLAK